jgi:hypothetical protein
VIFIKPQPFKSFSVKKIDCINLILPLLCTVVASRGTHSVPILHLSCLTQVSSKTKHVVHYSVKCGDIIIWEFATKKRDIGFGVLFEATEVATEKEPLPSSHESIEKKVMSILPLFRVGTHAHPTVGYHCATQDGIYEILFDNTYSRFFAKELFYRITTQSSEPNVNYLEQ